MSNKVTVYVHKKFIKQSPISRLRRQTVVVAVVEPAVVDDQLEVVAEVGIAQVLLPVQLLLHLQQVHRPRTDDDRGLEAHPFV